MSGLNSTLHVTSEDNGKVDQQSQGVIPPIVGIMNYNGSEKWEQITRRQVVVMINTFISWNCLLDTATNNNRPPQNSMQKTKLPHFHLTFVYNVYSGGGWRTLELKSEMICVSLRWCELQVWGVEVDSSSSVWVVGIMGMEVSVFSFISMVK